MANVLELAHAAPGLLLRGARRERGGAPMIDGDTKLIAHIGYPTATFRAPTIYNPWFRRRGINAVVVPLGVTSENFREAFP